MVWCFDKLKAQNEIEQEMWEKEEIRVKLNCPTKSAQNVLQ